MTWYNKFDPEFPDREMVLFDEIPHGSGLDGDHIISKKGSSWIVDSGFHPMDENGFYREWIDFKLTIPTNNPMEFTIKFKNKKLAEKFGLIDYLEDLFSYWITTSFIPLARGLGYDIP